MPPSKGIFKYGTSNGRICFQEYQAAFQQDCERLLLQFMECKTFDFSVFKNLWIENRFSLIYLGRYARSTLPYFIQMCFTCAKKYLIFGQSKHIQVGALYILYGLYYKQPLQHLTKIRILKDEMAIMIKLINDMKEQRQLEVLYIYNKLLEHEAFHFVCVQYSLALDSIYLKSDLQLENNTFSINQQLPEELKDITEEALKRICEVDDEYQKQLKEFLKNRESTVAPLKFTLAENLRSIVNTGKKISQPEDIHSSRSAVKQKAFTSQNQFKLEKTVLDTNLKIG